MNRTLLALAVLLALALPGRTSDRANLADALAAGANSTVLAVAAKEVGAVATLKGAGPYTLFAPTDAAFRKLDDDAIARLATGKEAMQRLVNAHLVAGRYTADDLRKRNGQSLKTAAGALVKVEDRKEGLFVGGAKVTGPDGICSNGVLHLVDAVFPLPKE